MTPNLFVTSVCTATTSQLSYIIIKLLICPPQYYFTVSMNITTLPDSPS
jgi:hypothetical protein